MIPQPEPFELRHWFDEEVVKLLGTLSDGVRERLRMVIDQEGGLQLRTPRAVVRALDSIRFFWPAVRGEQIDAADLVWLQLIKDGSPKLYRWIEKYVASAAATSFGTATVTDSSKAQRLEALLEAADQGQLTDVMYRHVFAEIVPGIEASYDDNGPPVAIHQKVSARDRQDAIHGRRLASPDHYRLYFSLIGPTHALTQAGFDQFWNALDASAVETAAILLTLQQQGALGTLRKIDVLLERLRGVDRSAWTGARAKNLLLAFGAIMDDVYRANPNDDRVIVSTWDRAERLVQTLYSALPVEERLSVTQELFATSPSIGWITSLLRHETFAHGFYGDRPKPSSEWYLSEDEFNVAREIMLTRYRALSLHDLLETLRPLQILFAWKQSGDDDGPRAFFQSAMSTDEGFISLLEQLTSSIDSSDRGRYTVLKRENVEPFTDYDAAVSRLEMIAKEGPTTLRSTARRLIEEVEGARDF